jgi:hypothetical protein
MSISSDVSCAVSVFADFAASDLAQLSTTTSTQIVQLASSGNAVLTAPSSVDGKIFRVSVAGYVHLTQNFNQSNVGLYVNGSLMHSITPHNASGAATYTFFMETKCSWNSTGQILVSYATLAAETVNFNFDPNTGNTINTVSIPLASDLTFTVRASVNNTDAGSYLKVTEFRILED